MVLASDFSVRTVTCTSVTRVSCVCICGRSTGPSPTPRSSTAEAEQTCPSAPSWPLEKTSNCSETRQKPYQVKLCWRRSDPLLVLPQEKLSENTDADTAWIFVMPMSVFTRMVKLHIISEIWRASAPARSGSHFMISAGSHDGLRSE